MRSRCLVPTLVLSADSHPFHTGILGGKEVARLVGSQANYYNQFVYAKPSPIFRIVIVRHWFQLLLAVFVSSGTIGREEEQPSMRTRI